MDFLVAADTLPSNPWVRDRVPAIVSALDGYDYKIIDIYAFTSTENAHEIHRTHKTHNFFHRDRPNLIDLNKIFLEKILQYNPKVLILGTVDNYHHFLLLETIEELQGKGIKVVGIMGDDEFNHGINKWYIPVFDYTIAYVKKIRDYYASIKDGCYFLPNSCFFPEEDFNKLQVPEEEKKHDVLFMGAPFGIRPKIIQSLLDKGVQVSIYGSKKWLEYPEFKDCYHGYAPSDEIPDIIRDSKIYLSLLEDHLTGELHMNTKIWDAVKFGQFTIITHYKPLMEDYNLKEDKELVMYRNIDDLVDKTIHYLKNPQQRISMAKILFESILNNFNYTSLYKEIFDDLHSNPNVVEKNEDTLLTIINLMPDDISTSYTNVISLNKYRWKSKIKEVLQNIDTPYVILRTDQHTYIKSINKFHKVIDGFFDKASFKALYLKELTEGRLAYQRNRFINLGCLLWDREFLLNNWEELTIRERFLMTKTPLEDSKIPFCQTSKKKMGSKLINYIDQKIHFRS